MQQERKAARSTPCVSHFAKNDYSGVRAIDVNTTAGGQDAGEAAVSAAAALRTPRKGAAPAPESAHS